ncbi:hypothetical protein MMC09_003521 [Bachmanniomyces sp. S44760]|nr:hypothetical protein [Bachmanniomyces sp. S44760]
MAQKCVHKGCGKTFTDSKENCIYHPGPPIFHEGQKGVSKPSNLKPRWKCCKPRVLTFDEFLSILPCTTGKHSEVDDSPAPEPAASKDQEPPAPRPISKPIPGELAARAPISAQAPTAPAPSAEPEPESESDDPSLAIPANTTCRRRGCNASSPDHLLENSSKRPSEATEGEQEECVFHPGHPIFHEGSKGWTCCKRRVLEFDEFLRIEGCQTRNRHMFVGSRKKRKGEGKEGEEAEEKVDNVRHDFYQTPTTIHASLYLKKISPSKASITFPSPTSIALDLPTTDKKRYKTTIPLYGPIITEESTWKIMGTKMDLMLEKDTTGGVASWPVLRSDERATGEIIQSGRAGRA